MNEKILEKIISIENEIFNELGPQEGTVLVDGGLLLKAAYHNLLICCVLDESKIGLFKSRYEKLKEAGIGRKMLKAGDEIPVAVMFMKMYFLCTDMDSLILSGVRIGSMNMYKSSGIITGLVA